MAGPVRKARVKEGPLSEIKDDFSRLLREAEKQEIVITRHGKPAGVLIGFESEDDGFDYKLENHPRFAQRIEQARRSLRDGEVSDWQLRRSKASTIGLRRVRPTAALTLGFRQ